MSLSAIKAPLISWYREVARDLPWRRFPSPYHVWISEIMLQQTRIEAVIPDYLRFMEAFPTVGDLAAAPDDLLMKHWEGLGYYSRARNLKRAAEAIVSEHGGQLPRSEEALRALPGIGDYTAGAIASLAFGLPCPAVDGNVLRVLARLNADPRNILDTAVKREAQAALRAVYPDAPEDAEMYDKILEGNYFDFGFCYGVSIGNISTIFRDYTGDIAQKWEQNKIAYQTQLEDVITALDDISFAMGG